MEERRARVYIYIYPLFCSRGYNNVRYQSDRWDYKRVIALVGKKLAKKRVFYAWLSGGNMAYRSWWLNIYRLYDFEYIFTVLNFQSSLVINFGPNFFLFLFFRKLISYLYKNPRANSPTPKNPNPHMSAVPQIIYAVPSTLSFSPRRIYIYAAPLPKLRKKEHRELNRHEKVEAQPILSSFPPPWEWADSSSSHCWSYNYSHQR